MKPTPQAGGRSGFTLMELMVVLVLIGIMTAMILPEMRGTYEEAVLSATGRRLANALGVAYSQSVTAQRAHRLRIDSAAHRYLIEKRELRDAGNGFVPARDLPGGEGALDARISIQVRKPGEDLSESTEASSPMGSTEAESFDSGADAIVFYPDGTADAREIQLEDRDGFRLAVRINPVTARVQIQELERR